jgi:Flp pilus assembly protein TadD
MAKEDEDKVVALNEGDVPKEELDEAEAEKQKELKAEEAKKNSINLSLPNPKVILKKNSQKLTEAIKPHMEKIKSYGLAVASVIILIVVLLLIFLGGNEEDEFIQKEDSGEFELLTDIAFQNSGKKQSKDTQVEELVQKANLLYQNGNREEALKLYGRIATYNASLSYYNLGVSRIKGGQCEEAIDAFDRAIQNREHITPSAINAGVCSNELNRTEEMMAYLDLAYKHLPEELDSSLYSFYYSMIAYYRGDYFETFSSLKHRTSDYFSDTKNMMETRVNLIFENYTNGADALEKSVQKEDRASLGLLYANFGELELAKENLAKAIENTNKKDLEFAENSLALSLVDLKLGNIGTSGGRIKSLVKQFGEENLSKFYEYDLSLKEDLFDVQKAQRYFRKELQFVKYPAYQILFHFAPYKVFDAKKSLSIIRKGSANIAVGDNMEAGGYLERGAKSSDVNKDIVLAIKEILNKRLRLANKMLREIEVDNQKHSILQYDLGLTYAQLGDMETASKHFVKSFHLNSRDFLAGIFALLSGELAGKDLSQLAQVLQENLAFEEDGQEKSLYYALLSFQNGAGSALKKWLNQQDDKSKNDLFQLGLAYLSTIYIDQQEENKQIARRILSKLPEDILANLLYMYSYFKDLDIKEFSGKAIRHFQTHQLPLSDFYYGSRITQEMFIKFHLLTGKLDELEKKLEYFNKVEIRNREGVLQALALTKIYNQKFEEAFQIYNDLIDNYKLRDSRTLFLAGISAIGAKHFNNAVALFELARLKNNYNLETRYALGLLYLQVKNFEASRVQFNKFGGTAFFSDFFDFNIKN